MGANRLMNLVGKRFGKLTVLCATKGRSSKGGKYWDCKCDCGEIKPYRSDVLRKQNIKSCGCTMEHVKVGDKIGILTVAEKLGRTKSRSIRWECRCDCGGEISLTSHTIKEGNTKSCGCLRNPSGQKHPNYVGYGDMPGNFFNRARHGAETRGISFKITKKQIWNLFEKQKRKCVLSGMDLDFGVRSRIEEKKRECTASLDRIDNTKGYIKGNIQWVHKDVNKMKNTHSQEYFVNICKLVARKVGRKMGRPRFEDKEVIDYLFALHDRRVLLKDKLETELGVNFKTGEITKNSLLNCYYPKVCMDTFFNLFDRKLIGEEALKQGFKKALQLGGRGEKDKEKEEKEKK